MARNTMSRNLIRRLPRAALVALLSGSILGAAMGAAFAAGESELPKSFGIADMHSGDRGHYAMTAWLEWSGTVLGEYHEAEREEMQGEIQYEWLPAKKTYAADGTQRWAHPVVLHISEREVGDGEDWKYTREILSDANTGETLGARTTGNHSAAYDVAGIAGVGAQSREFAEDTIYWSFDEVPLLCGLKSQLQGQNLDTRKPVLVDGSCVFDEDQPARVEFIAQAVETVQGMETVRYDAATKFGQTSLWFAREAPVPVRMHQTLSVQEENFTGTGSFTLDLIGFEAGNSAYPPLPSVAGPAAPSIELAPASFLGPDASGFDMDFSLQDAWNAAERQNPDVHDYLDRHPGAYLAYAHYRIRVDENQTHPHWVLVITDGADESMTILAYAPTHPVATDMADILDLAGPPIIGSQTFVWFGNELSGWFAPPHLLPDRLPSVASVAGAWAAFDAEFDEASEANSWGFVIYCGFVNCTEAQGEIHVGRDGTPTMEADPLAFVLGGENEARENFTALTVDLDGAIIEYQETHARAAQRDAGLLASSDQKDPPAPTPNDEPLATISPWWVWPSPAAAAGAGVLGLLIGVVYWLWPTIQSAPMFGLFSRLRENQVLEHPTRSRIMQELEREPGLHHSELCRRMGAGNGVVEHHLRILVANDLVVRRKEAGYACFFPARGVDRRDSAAMPWLKSQGARKVMVSVVARPGQSGKDIAAASGLDPATVTYHLKRLREAGLVDARRDGRRLAVHATAQGHRMAQAA